VTVTPTVVVLGAWCDLVPAEESTASPGGQSFVVQEFAVLADGRRLTLHAERGWTTWLRSTDQPEPLDPWSLLTAADLERDVLNVVLPDEDDGKAHPWEWLQDLLRAQGVDVPVEQLRAVPYRVELSDRVRARLAAADPGGDVAP
jgi:hypothetical protein